MKNRRRTWFDRHETIATAGILCGIVLLFITIHHFCSPADVTVEESVRTGKITAKDQDGNILPVVPSHYKHHVYVK